MLCFFVFTLHKIGNFSLTRSKSLLSSQVTQKATANKTSAVPIHTMACGYLLKWDKDVQSIHHLPTAVFYNMHKYIFISMMKYVRVNCLRYYIWIGYTFSKTGSLIELFGYFINYKQMIPHRTTQEYIPAEWV